MDNPHQEPAWARRLTERKARRNGAHGMARRIASEELGSGNTVIERLPNLIAHIGLDVVKCSLESLAPECTNPLGGHGHQRRASL